MCSSAERHSQSGAGEVGLCVPTLGATATQGSRSPLICQIKDPASATEGCFVALVLVVFSRVHVKREIGRDFRSRRSHEREKNDQPLSPWGEIFKGERCKDAPL